MFSFLKGTKLYIYASWLLLTIGSLLAVKYQAGRARKYKRKAMQAEARAQRAVLIQEASERAEKESIKRHERAKKAGRDYWDRRNALLDIDRELRDG